MKTLLQCTSNISDFQSVKQLNRKGGLLVILLFINKTMNRRDEEYLFECIEDIKSEVHENNKMLRQICGVINTYLANHQRENEDDFSRNVLANIVSSKFIGAK